ncbi:cytochrome P450 [Rhizoctonia solani AG-1 IA]|uniref:peptidylprolyl isomerase n=1 Tax=Thanatephorus cucumeris (strain AG1-IA) TaxID=983506 RepID=L8WPS8_THACA|nr:cytochrome P450 [Rhizoctonia solani AG-1 IA]
MVDYVAQLNSSIINKKLTDNIHESENVQSILKLLEQVEAIAQDTPPVNNDASRFGNPAFKAFYDKVQEVGEFEIYRTGYLMWLNKALPSLHSSIPHISQAAVPEISLYLQECWGNRARIDYGSNGAWVDMLLRFCLEKLGVLSTEDHSALVLRVFWKYLNVMRYLQKTYWLEPAGSHGVWGLDDYHFLPFLWGSGQLVGHPHLRPKSIHNAEVKTWDKVNSGMIKMYNAEVLGKLPVAQHFLFGSIIKRPDGIQASTEGTTNDPHWGHAHAGVGAVGQSHSGWGDCCGIPVPSAFAAAEAEKRGNRPGGAPLSGTGIRPRATVLDLYKQLDLGSQAEQKVIHRPFLAIGFAAVAALIGTWALVDTYKKSRQLPLPPGPPEKSWISGNALDMPQSHLWLKFTDWAKRYGKLLIPELLGWAGSTSCLLSHMATAGEHIGAKPILASIKKRLLSIKMDRPETYTYSYKGCFPTLKTLFPKLNGSIIMRTTYGYKVLETNDPHITIADDALASLEFTGVAGNYIVDSYPFLRHLPTWLPGMNFKKQAEEWSKYPARMAQEPFDWTKQQMRTGQAVPSFLSGLLEQNKDGPSGEDVIKWTSASMYSAGAHTTVGTISNFLLAMILYPDVLRKAREEVDRVVGTERLPLISDRADLPYIESVLLETLRWYPVAPLAIPHRILQDDEYRGYRIPAGSTLISNIYAITRDERIYPDPENFIPERFDANQPGPSPPNPRDFVFGIGRRICPGNHIADASVWLAIANLVATMDISKACDSNGVPIEPVPERCSGFVCQLRPFPCSIKPRSEKAVQLINSAVMFEHE